jgi:hypothetical protein
VDSMASTGDSVATSLVADVSVISVNSMASTASSLATPPVANSSVTSVDSVTQWIRFLL